MTFTLEPTRTRTRTERAEPTEAVPVQAVPVQTAQVDQREEPAVATVPALTWPVEQPAIKKPARVRTVLAPRTARRLALVSFLSFWATVFIEPSPTGSQPVMVWWADALSLGSLVLLAASWIQLASGRRTGLTSGFAGGAGLLGLTASCPAMDHHEIAAWWFVQLAVSLLIMGTSAVLLRRTKRA
jgi:hypothetical protein